MSRFRSHYDEPSALVISADGASKALTCEPGGEVDVPDHFDRLVLSHCPRWSKVEPKAAEALKAPAPAQQSQHHHKGGK